MKGLVLINADREIKLIFGVLQKGLFPGNSCAGKRLVATRQAGIQSITLFRTMPFSQNRRFASLSLAFERMRANRSFSYNNCLLLCFLRFFESMEFRTLKARAIPAQGNALDTMHK